MRDSDYFRIVIKSAIMTVTLELEPEVELTATEQAKEEGLPLAEYVESVVKEAILKRRSVRRLSEKSFDEILKPFRDEVEASGMNDDEFDDFVEEIHEEIYQEELVSDSVSKWQLSEQ